MPFIIPTNIKFYVNDNKYYIIIDSDYFGEVVRFGDFVMMSSLLFIIKLNLIASYEKLTADNFYFYLNNKNNIKLNNVNRLFKLFKNLYDYKVRINKSQYKNYNFDQILPRGNLWFYKCYLNNCNYRLLNNYKMIVPEVSADDVDKNTVYILPVINKTYNIERNWNIDMISNIIKGVDNTYNIKIISLDNYRLNKTNERLLKKVRSDIIFLKKVNWYDIINGISLTCKEFIGGDCGMMHFVCALSKPYSPDKITCYYNTKDCKEGTKVFFKYLTHSDKISNEVNFKPLPLYENTKIGVKTF
jgi:hypothetical protein